MAALLTDVTSSSTSTATSFTAPCTVYVDGDFGHDRSKVHILMASTEAGEYHVVQTIKRNTRRRKTIDGQGTYWLKAQFVLDDDGTTAGLSVSTT